MSIAELADLADALVGSGKQLPAVADTHGH